MGHRSDDEPRRCGNSGGHHPVTQSLLDKVSAPFREPVSSDHLGSDIHTYCTDGVVTNAPLTM
jgi:hypothetical protein